MFVHNLHIEGAPEFCYAAGGAADLAAAAGQRAAARFFFFLFAQRIFSSYAPPMRSKLGLLFAYGLDV